MILIKKYKNRKLYLVGKEGKYVTLKDINYLLQMGSMIRVLESVTKKDITEQILLQCKLEELKHE